MFRSKTPEGDSIRVHLDTLNGQAAAPASVRGSLLKWLRPILRLVQMVWKKVCADIDSRCYPVQQPSNASPDASKPMSLNAKIVADIWILKNKL